MSCLGSQSGATVTVIFDPGQGRPDAVTADQTRSARCPTPHPCIPCCSNPGSPGSVTAVTSSTRPLTPDSVADFTRASIHATSAAFPTTSSTEPSGSTVTITSHRSS